MKEFENNRVVINGEITKAPEYDHITCGETFNKMFVSVLRMSGAADVIPVIVSERLFRTEDLHVGDLVDIKGCYRSFNYHCDNGRNQLKLNVLAEEIEVITDRSYMNSIELNGYICKEPVYRETPLGRQICDCMIAVNRAYGKSDYIPCIAWGRNAKFLSSQSLGTQVKFEGRIQSREYQKKLSDGNIENKVAYEVSVSKIEIIDESEE